MKDCVILNIIILIFVPTKLVNGASIPEECNRCTCNKTLIAIQASIQALKEPQKDPNRCDLPELFDPEGKF